MALTTLPARDITRILKSVPSLVDLPAKKLWIDYDEQADLRSLASLEKVA